MHTHTHTHTCTHTHTHTHTNKYFILENYNHVVFYKTSIIYFLWLWNKVEFEIYIYSDLTGKCLSPAMLFKKHDCYSQFSDAILSPHYLLKLGNPLKIISPYKLDIYIRTVPQLYNRGDGPDTSECK